MTWKSFFFILLLSFNGSCHFVAIYHSFSYSVWFLSPPPFHKTFVVAWKSILYSIWIIKGCVLGMWLKYFLCLFSAVGHSQTCTAKGSIWSAAKQTGSSAWPGVGDGAAGHGFNIGRDLPLPCWSSIQQSQSGAGSPGEVETDSGSESHRAASTSEPTEFGNSPFLPEASLYLRQGECGNC